MEDRVSPGGVTPDASSEERWKEAFAAPPAPLDGGNYEPDDEALAGTRFGFGGRRPYSFSPRPGMPAGHQPGSQRPLPGIGTVALGKVVRTMPYGAFVDLLGFRGLVHISQLMPGYRVDRVEDVVRVGDEVVVRVIAVDPERRHINLALVPSASGVVTTTASGATGPAATGSSRPAAARPIVTRRPSGPPSSDDDVTPTLPLETGPPADGRVAPPSTEAPIAAALQPAPSVAGRREPAAAAAALATPALSGPMSPAVSPASPALPGSRTPPAVPAPRESTLPATLPAPARPAEEGRPEARLVSPSRAAPASRPAPRAKARPSPPISPRHPSRAVRRDLIEPSHPMTRLLAMVDNELRRGGDARQGVPGPLVSNIHHAPEVSAGSNGAEQRTVSPADWAPRPIHVAEPEPEPVAAQPATLEALAARFGQKRQAKAPPGPAGLAVKRSRQEREKQAAILARLRGQST